MKLLMGSTQLPMLQVNIYIADLVYMYMFLYLNVGIQGMIVLAKCTMLRFGCTY